MPPIRSIARFIWNELRRPYGWPGIVMGIGLLLFLGAALWSIGEWIVGWWG